jgi:hypothetical protein
MDDERGSGMAAEEERRLAETAALAGVRIEPGDLPAAVAFLAEVRQAADGLLALDLDGAAPDAVFDPRWPEGER